MFRHIVHIHIPAFPIAVERVRRTELRGRPVVTVQGTGRPRICTASREATAEGIFKGMSLSKALKMCPKLALCDPHPGLVARAARALADMAGRYAPLWESPRPGRLYLDLTGTDRLWGRAKDSALRISRETGNDLSLPATVGVAGNKMVADIASRFTLSGGAVRDVDHGREAPFVAPFKVNVIPGVGRCRRRVLLEELNIIRVRELAALDLHRLQMLFGSGAFVIQQRARGIDPRPVRPPGGPSVISEEILLPEGENNDRKILGLIFTMLERASLRLRREGLFPRKTGLLIRYADNIEVRRQTACPVPGHWAFDLYPGIKGLYFKACARRTRLRFIRIWFSGLIRENGQLGFFDGRTPGREKKIMVCRGVDRVRERYGEAAIRYGVAAQDERPKAKREARGR